MWGSEADTSWTGYARLIPPGRTPAGHRPAIDLPPTCPQPALARDFRHEGRSRSPAPSSARREPGPVPHAVLTAPRLARVTSPLRGGALRGRQTGVQGPHGSPPRSSGGRAPRPGRKDRLHGVQGGSHAHAHGFDAELTTSSSPASSSPVPGRTGAFTLPTTPSVRFSVLGSVAWCCMVRAPRAAPRISGPACGRGRRRPAPGPGARLSRSGAGAKRRTPPPRPERGGHLFNSRAAHIPSLPDRAKHNSVNYPRSGFQDSPNEPPPGMYAAYSCRSSRSRGDGPGPQRGPPHGRDCSPHRRGRPLPPASGAPTSPPFLRRYAASEALRGGCSPLRTERALGTREKAHRGLWEVVR